MYRSLPLAKGFLRKQVYNKLPEEYKEALRSIAKSENSSMTWVLEQIIVDWIHQQVRIAKPHYRKTADLKVIRGHRKAS